MSLRRTFLLVLLLALYRTPAWAAANPACDPLDNTVACVPRINTVFTVNTMDLTTNASYSSFYLVSYGSTTTPGTVTPQDGAAGLFVKAACNGRGDDGGAVLQDSKHSCFFRQNLNGDLRQWGVTVGSSYDANAAVPPTPPQGLSQQLVHTILPDLALAGITNVTTSQVSIFLDKYNTSGAIDIPASVSFGCGATGPTITSGADYLGKPGTIFIAHQAYIHFPQHDDGSSIHNCLILPSWLLPNSKTQPTNTQASSVCSATSDNISSPNSGVSFNYPALAYADLEAIRANMIICADYPLYFDTVSGGTSHDLFVFGFDNPFYISSADHYTLNNTAADGNICYYTVGGGGLTNLTNADCMVQLTHDVSKVPNPTNTHCVQSDGGGQNICNSEYWQVADIEPSSTTNSYGRHDCKVYIVSGNHSGQWYDSMGNATAPATSLFPSTGFLRMPVPVTSTRATGDPVNYPVWLSNLNSGTANISCLGNGAFAVANVNTSASVPNSLNPWFGTTTQVVSFDLLESEYGMTGSDVMSANVMWDACTTPPCAIRIASGNVDAMVAGEGVSGPSTIPPNTTITSVVRNAKGLDPYDGYIAEIMVNNALPIAANTGTDTTISITSDPAGLGRFMPAAPGSGVLCDDALLGQCLFLQSDERAFAGNSNPADAASVMLPQSNARNFAAGYLDQQTAGLSMINTFSYGHHYGYVVQDANSTLMIGRAGDENGELDDLGEDFYVANGSSNNPTTSGGKGGQSGTGIVNNFYKLVDDNTGAYFRAPIPSLTVGQVVTVTGGTGSIPTDQNHPGVIGGKGTFGVCSNYSTMNNACQGNEEYVTYEISSSTQITLTSRGDYFTTPKIISNAYLVQASVSPTGYCSSFSNTLAPVTNKGLNQFENIRDCLLLVNIASPEQKNAFVGGNATSTNISNSLLSGTTFLYENAAAFASMKGCGDTLITNLAWHCRHPPGASATVTASRTLDTTADVWVCDASIGGVTLTLPLGSSLPNWQFEIKKIDTSSNTCSVMTSSFDTLDGLRSLALTAQNQDVLITNSNGSSTWYTKPISMLAHGQVYLSLDTGNARLQLCPLGGGGLIIDNVLQAIPAGCLYMQNTSATNSSVLNYIYATNFVSAVSGVAAGTGSAIEVTLTGASVFAVNDQVLATCSGIQGTPEANISGLAKMKSATKFDFNAGTLVGTNIPLTGTCTLLGIDAVNIGHQTAPNGVEIRGMGPTYTLVGIVYVGASKALNDSLTKRDVLSWFNRQPKKMLVACTSGTTTSSSTYKTLATPCEGEFVSAGAPGAPGTYPVPQVPWAVNAAVANSALGTEGTSVCFSTTAQSGTTICTHETEESFSAQNTANNDQPASVQGGSTTLTEGRNFMDLAGSCSAGTCTYDTSHTTIQVNIPQ